jgi:hypothetical protein
MEESMPSAWSPTMLLRLLIGKLRNIRKPGSKWRNDVRSAAKIQEEISMSRFAGV